MKNTQPSLDSFPVKNSDHHSLDYLKFVFSQADKRLDDSHKTFDATTGKSVTLITLLVALLTTMSAYFFVNNDFHGVLNEKLITVLLLCVYVLCLLSYLTKNILPQDYLPSGSLPNLLLRKKTSDKPVTDEIHLKDVYFSELVNHQYKIECNFKVNEPRLVRIRVAINWLIGMPIMGVLLYAAIAFLLSRYLHSFSPIGLY